MNGLTALLAANRFLGTRFPTCQTAILAGSVARGEETPTSDIDLVIFDNSLTHAFRESFIEFGWKIETFVFNEQTYIEQLHIDRQTARPSLATMVTSGVVLKDSTGNYQWLKKIAEDSIEAGPQNLSAGSIASARYFICDLLEDLQDATDRSEALMIANALSIQVGEFILRRNRQWIGRGKTLTRALKWFDSSVSEQFFEALDEYYKYDKKDALVSFTLDILDIPLDSCFAGFRQVRQEHDGVVFQDVSYLTRFLFEQSHEKRLVVGMDGMSRSGKTTLTKQIAMRLKDLGREVTLLHLDDYITSRADRYNTEYESWYEFYQLQWDVPFLREHLFEVVRTGERMHLPLYLPESDSHQERTIAIPETGIVLVEGLFLQRPEWRSYFDYVIYLDCPREARFSRESLSNRKNIEKFKERYWPAEEKYLADVMPKQLADFVVET